MKNLKTKKAKKDPASRNIPKENPAAIKQRDPRRRKPEQDRNDAKTRPPGTVPHKDVHKEKIFRILICLFFVISISSVYWQVGNHDFLNFDDPVYITENPYVNSGLSLENIRWAFTSFHASNWHPLTWLSHMADSQIFGLEAGRHHLVNVFLHIMNSILLFLILNRMTGMLWRSAFVAALFALHPLHVESVAWAAERKDVLSALFWMLTMGAYAFYVERPGRKRYLIVLILFTLGLMAKPMLVTLPFVLLLLDFWPLARIVPEAAPVPFFQRLAPLVREKVPLFFLSAASCIITYMAQKQGDAVETITSLSIPDRFANASYSYIQYILKMFWPQDLAAFYPFPESSALWQTAFSVMLLAAVTVSVFIARRLPFLAVGWLWYLGTLVPVIGLVQVGSQAMADRYTYIPLIGIFLMAAWGVPELMKSVRLKAAASAAAAVAVLLILSLAAVAWKQVSYWSNNLTLFGRAIEVTERNHLAHNNIGLAFLERGDLDTAAMHFQKAMSYNPRQSFAFNNLGMVYHKQGRTDDAVSLFWQALLINPDSAEAYSNLGDALASQGKTEEAMRCFRESLRLKPENASAFLNLGYAAAGRGNWNDAINYFEKAVRIRPNLAEARYNLGNSLVAARRAEEAVVHFREALRIKPDYAKGYNNLGSTLLLLGRVEEAIASFQRALEVQPDYKTAQENLRDALDIQKKARSHN
ncbi:MAG: tetratricopeptide repeat protein [Syntrophales bacterium]|nr:tetratricopeptide repeat protein [Syntrophales bacterium]